MDLKVLIQQMDVWSRGHSLPTVWIKKALGETIRRETEKHREAIPEAMGNLRFPLDFYLSWISQNRFPVFFVIPDLIRNPVTLSFYFIKTMNYELPI